MQVRASISQKGLTLAELLVAIMVIGILGAVGYSVTFSWLNRNRVDSFVIDWSGWIEQVRNKASDRVSASDNSGGCQISAASSLLGLRSGDQVATVSPTTCASSSIFVVPAYFGNPTFDVSIPSSVVYTPRGSVTNQSDIDFKVLLKPSGPLRCIRITSVLGMVQIGKNDVATSLSSACSTYARL